jgi:DNA-binding CsgD family transcriptional regulator
LVRWKQGKESAATTEERGVARSRQGCSGLVPRSSLRKGSPPIAELVLTDRDRALYENVLETLLSPLTYDSIPCWGEAVSRGLVALFRADQSIFSVPMDLDFEFLASGMDSDTADSVRQTMEALNDGEPGRSPYLDEYLLRAMTCMKAERTEIWNIPIWSSAAGTEFQKTLFYREVVGASGVKHQTVMGTACGGSMAMTGIAHTSVDGGPFLDQELDLMGLLLPAFKAGVHVQGRLHERRHDLARSLDTLEEPLIILDANGREIQRNAAMLRLSEEEPESATLLSEMRALGKDLGLRTRNRRKSSARTRWAGGSRRVRTRRGSYTLRGSYFRPEIFARRAVVLVTIAERPPTLPSEAALRKRFDLTGREAEVASLLARGLSNREIAERLAISRHTVRHHSEHVFLKLDVHTRKALALRLLGRKT